MEGNDRRFIGGECEDDLLKENVRTIWWRRMGERFGKGEHEDGFMDWNSRAIFGGDFEDNLMKKNVRTIRWESVVEA